MLAAILFLHWKEHNSACTGTEASTSSNFFMPGVQGLTFERFLFLFNTLTKCLSSQLIHFTPFYYTVVWSG